MMWKTKIVSAVLLAAAVLSVASGVEPVAYSDWPQWRGPMRDGVVPHSPKLLDAWPKDGPRLLWKSASLTTVQKGYHPVADGCASVVVAGNKVFCYVNGCTLSSSRIVSDKLLKELGWRPATAALPAGSTSSS